MSDIMLHDITYEVDGKLYTTRLGYDHSWLCDISMDDLVPIMRTPQQALDEIAYLIQVQASIKEQDRWLKRAIEAGLVKELEE